MSDEPETDFPESGPPPRVVNTVIVFTLGAIAAWIAMGVVPYWRLIKQIWQGCVA